MNSICPKEWFSELGKNLTVPNLGNLRYPLVKYFYEGAQVSEKLEQKLNLVRPLQY